MSRPPQHYRRRRRSAAAALCAFALLAAAAGPAGAAAERVKSGTGFFVSHDGFLVTSAHVVSGCPSVLVWQPDGRERPGYVVAADTRIDLALLWADGMRSPDAASLDGIPPRAGEAVFTLGFGVIATTPLQPVFVAGSLLGPSTIGPGNPILAMHVRLHAGHSGGAVLARDGALVGMVIGRDERHPDVGVALPARDIAAFLADYGILLPQREGEAPPDLLRAISVLVQCSP